MENRVYACKLRLIVMSFWANVTNWKRNASIIQMPLCLCVYYGTMAINFLCLHSPTSPYCKPVSGVCAFFCLVAVVFLFVDISISIHFTCTHSIYQPLQSDPFAYPLIWMRIHFHTSKHSDLVFISTILKMAFNGQNSFDIVVSHIIRKNRNS